MNIFSKKYRGFLLGMIVMILTGCMSKNLTSNNRPFFFFQMADPQFGMFTDNNGFAKETINFGKAIEAANRLHPAFVIVCGDLVNKTGDSDQITEYKRIVAKLDPTIPLYNVPGNHDVLNRPTHNSLVRYRENFGPDYYSFESGNLYGIVINSSLFFNPSGAPDEAVKQDEWLRSQLKNAKKLKYTNIVIFQHISWFLNRPDEKGQYFNIPLDRRETYLGLFHNYGVKYIFAGHLHKNSIGWDRGLEMVTTGPVGKPLGKDPSGFRIVTIKDNNIKHKYFSLDSIPKVIHLDNSPL